MFPDILIRAVPLIDVRAPVEFSQGHLPGAVNLPILNNQEREQIGITYKQQGPEAAVALGHRLVSGETKEERVEAWGHFVKTNPGARIYCFRGGLRSQIAQRWVREAGMDIELIPGGYKAARRYLLEHLNGISRKDSLLVLSGPTGSGKTRLLEEMKKLRACVDLESLARHRGSAFGATGREQPTQTQFENDLGVALLRQENQQILVENESRLIGRCALPDNFLAALRSAPAVWIEESLEQRVENILQEYVAGAADKPGLFAYYRQAIQNISRKLGGLRTQEFFLLLDEARTAYENKGDLEPNRVWIEKLLREYYDPFYRHGLEQRTGPAVFRGSYLECRQYLQDELDLCWK